MSEWVIFETKRLKGRERKSYKGIFFNDFRTSIPTLRFQAPRVNVIKIMPLVGSIGPMK